MQRLFNLIMQLLGVKVDYPQGSEDFYPMTGKTSSPTHKYHKERTTVEMFGDKSVWRTTFFASNDKKRWQVIGFVEQTILEWLGTHPQERERHTPRRGNGIPSMPRGR